MRKERGERSPTTPASTRASTPDPKVGEAMIVGASPIAAGVTEGEADKAVASVLMAAASVLMAATKATLATLATAATVATMATTTAPTKEADVKVGAVGELGLTRKQACRTQGPT